MSNNQGMRWYDKDPILKEALELLRLSTDEQKEQADRLKGLSDIIAKIGVSRHLGDLARGKAEEILHHPAADDRIIGQNDDRHDGCKPSDE